ncbi:MAG: saccharopine dehydrogenase NADP-binding domain-containing protein [Clostridiales Family XIII bacterium]|jgi:saccharopine dehydrogenase-like NADP-dependent oxidoreductase|nr:saccharopine dehydrogenase NADP-binding domain-containing protein [Clostridiales Family XIII bacterium]
MGKRILVLGTGAQGSTVAMRMDEIPEVDEIICADYSKEAADELVKILTKGRSAQVNAKDKDHIVEIAQGVDLIVNALPLEYGKNVIEAALEVKAGYQDFAAPEHIVPSDDWIEGIEYMLTEYNERFKAIGKTAIMGTGSAPGLICVATRRAVRELDRCDTIYNLVYEGVESKRFIPYWWSPITALSDMSEDAYAFENGKQIRTTPFSLPLKRTYDYVGYETTFVEHAHDEPVYMGINSERYFKGAQNIYFKYSGVGIDYARPLYRSGLLSHNPEPTPDGGSIIPFDLVLKHTPPAPKYASEIKSIIDEGLVSDTGAMVVEAYGKKDGKDVRVEVHVFAPGLVESFEKAGISSEMYITGQGGAMFTKMHVLDKYVKNGLFSSDMLEDEEVDYYFEMAAELDITLDIRVIEI